MASLTRTLPPQDRPVTRGTVKAGLRIDTDADDALLDTLIDVATADAENLMRRAIMWQTWTLLLDRMPERITLPYPRARSVSVDWMQTADVWTPLHSSQYRLIPGIICTLVPAYGITWPVPIEQPDCVRVIYEAASYVTQDEVPAAIRHWIVARVGELYEHREMSSGLQLQRHRFLFSLLAPYICPDYGWRHSDAGG